jgi:diguanylate cyclase (GGDEF)-like protein
MEDNVTGPVSEPSLPDERDLSCLSAVMEIVFAAKDVPHLLEGGLASILTAVKADRGVIYLDEAAGKALQLATCLGFEPAQASALQPVVLRATQGTIGRVYTFLETWSSHSPEQEFKGAPLLPWEQVARSVVFLPMTYPGGALGVLGVFSDLPLPWSDRDLRLLTAVARQLGLAVRDLRTADELVRLSHTDALTGVLNRTFFFELAEREYKIAIRHHRSLSLLMLDVDHLRDINEAYGMQAGDMLLRLLAQTITNVVRQVDLVARFSGDEFIILLPDCGLEDVQRVRGRLIAGIADLTVPLAEASIPIVVRFGLACMSDIPLASLDALFQQAEAELFL